MSAGVSTSEDGEAVSGNAAQCHHHSKTGAFIAFQNILRIAVLIEVKNFLPVKFELYI